MASNDTNSDINAVHFCGGPKVSCPIPSCGCGEEIVPWGCVSTVRQRLTPEECEEFCDELILQALGWATEQLQELTGHQYGLQTYRFMPDVGKCCCCLKDDCCCSPKSIRKVPHSDICYITRAVINCVDQPLQNYGVGQDGEGNGYIAFLLGDLPDTQFPEKGFCQAPYTNDSDCTNWWFEYVAGCPAPLQAIPAVTKLAHEYLYLCSVDPDRCSLPDNVTSIVRQGITVSFDFSSHLTGVREVDSFLKWANPHGLRKGANVLSPRNQHC